MVLIKDNLQVIENALEPWHKEVLEFTMNNIKTTVVQQFKHYYQHACFAGDLDELVTALKIKTQDCVDILYKLQDLKRNITKITQLDQYNKVTLQYRDTLGTTASVTGSASLTKSENTTTDTGVSTDRTTNSNKNLDETGSSQTNRLHPISDVLTPTTADENGYTEGALNKPIQYQNFGITQSINNSINVNNVNTNQTSKGNSTSGTETASHNTTGSKTDESQQKVEYTTIDERLRMWNLEMPRLRRKFWQMYSNLFTYNYF